MEHVSALTHLVNRFFGSFALSLLSALHVKPTDPENPIPEHVVMALAVLVVGTLLRSVGALSTLGRAPWRFSANRRNSAE